MRPTATFVNCVYTVKIAKEIRLLGIPLIVIFPLAALKTAHNNACDVCHVKVADPCFIRHFYTPVLYRQLM
jgi:hypothetical protein